MFVDRKDLLLYWFGKFTVYRLDWDLIIWLIRKYHV
jgi:hypothetical protein